ncbi:hypothetical protein O9929_11915 [Vibrio lentus]|nr:hypothetical protein [Vibrio lentus]
MKVETESKGEMTMAAYLADEQFRTQGFMLIHKGEIVTKRIRHEPDRQSCMSWQPKLPSVQLWQCWSKRAKSTEKGITHYVPELKRNQLGRHYCNCIRCSICLRR